MTTTQATPVLSRNTFDGKSITLWSDGCVTDTAARQLRGIGAARTPAGQAVNLDAGILAFGDVAVYRFAEVAKLVAAARRAVRTHAERSGQVAAVRSAMNPKPVAHKAACTCRKCLAGHVDCRRMYCPVCG